jgi:hypothetical protein
MKTITLFNHCDYYKLFDNPKSLKRLIQRYGLFTFMTDLNYSGILMLSKRYGIKVIYNNFVDGSKNYEIQIYHYNLTRKEFSFIEKL